MPYQAMRYGVCEVGESSAPIYTFNDVREARKTCGEANARWRKISGAIWLLWWLLRGGRQKYEVREEIVTLYYPEEQSDDA